MALHCGNRSNQTSPPSEDAKLVALAKAGDENAYADLIKGALPTARRAVRNILRAEADAEDALQDATIRSYFKLSTFDGRAKFSTWFTRIAINSALMMRRKYKNGCEVTGDAEKNELLLVAIADPRPDPLTTLRIKREYEILRCAINSLPLSLKEGLQIRLSDDLSLNEIANRLHLSLPATKTRLLRAKRLVIAKAAARLTPSVRTNGEPQEVLPVSSGESIGVERAVR
ncbi:sigma-70 family RNA polymerase sigma factor [Tunturiibacter gelidoferens]|uniref:RNA polymerase sigma-70 factor (ECF subfamily) n=1 Tax=Tunturiibacter gelidiferens TaxID=3069689 RepID=A0A9X0QHP8_9BACT|nr:sigma-70 family RNA polymerase sigma factor [Edaphobacter lichenicola]MBB5330344.1 RNA polymerase sigma-70 factor (ECF subfamily) [Edaphobacter lichenicola]